MDHARPHPIAQDIPLPGHYPCLTLQLNVTRYQSQGLVRATLIVREPSGHLELRRVIFDSQEDAESFSAAVALAVDGALAEMRWMQGGSIRD